MRRPRIKPEHTPCRIEDGCVIRIGGPTYGTAAEVEDPTGSVWTLLKSMDGTRDEDQIVRRVREFHPAETPSAVRAALRLFVEAGYVEDAGAPDPPELTERDKQRFDRSRAYFRWVDLTPRASTWEPQIALGRAEVTVIGLGGTGGIAAMALAVSGVGRIRCVDPDVVRLTNLNRQLLYAEHDIGRAKVDAAVERLGQLNSAVTMVGLRRRVTGVNDVIPLAARCDVLLLCADQPPDLRRWTNRACLVTGTPWVDAGYHGPVIQVGTFVPGVGPCWECVRAAEVERHGAGVRYEDTRRRDEAVANAVAAPTAGLSGHLAAHHAIALITGVPAVPAGRVDAVNIMAPDASFVRDDPRRPDCPACATPTAGGSAGPPARVAPRVRQRRVGR